MSKQINIIVVSVFFVFLLFSSVFCEESISITTYYPSPYGSYNELSTTGNTNLATSSGNVGVGTSSPQSLLQVGSSGYFQFSNTSAGAPALPACDTNAERGRMVIDTVNNRLYICNGATRGWDYIALTD